MQANIQHLHEISKKAKRTIVGLMSGTSLDGLDIALCEISGFGLSTHIDLKHFKTISYSEQTKDKIRTVFAKDEVSLEYLTLLNAWLGKYHGQLINQALAEWGILREDVDAIASHGQTIYHCPKHQHQHADFENATLQIGDGDHIAVTTGIVTLSDFRQKHIAAGGEGAPLAQFGDFLCFSSKEEARILLNLGGIANMTFFPKTCVFEEVLCSDLGPSNTMIDNYMQLNFGEDYDENGKVASTGRTNQRLLALLLQHDFFGLALPKSTGPETFNLSLLDAVKDEAKIGYISHEDMLATLSELSAKSIAKQLNSLATSDIIHVYASGGGVHNSYLWSRIHASVNERVILKTSAELSLDPDAKEAVLFAILANEALAGSSEDCGFTMGKISLPS